LQQLHQAQVVVVGVTEHQQELVMAVQVVVQVKDKHRDQETLAVILQLKVMQVVMIHLPILLTAQVAAAVHLL
jgi:hypothetical protein